MGVVQGHGQPGEERPGAAGSGPGSRDEEAARGPDVAAASHPDCPGRAPLGEAPNSTGAPVGHGDPASPWAAPALTQQPPGPRPAPQAPGRQPNGYPSGSYPPPGPPPAGWYGPSAPGAPGAPGPRPSRFAPAQVRTHRWGLGAYLLVEIVFLVTSALVGFVVVGDADPTASTLAIALAVPTVLAAATALLITRLRGNGPRIDLCLDWSWRDVRLGLAFGFGGLALTIPASVLYVAIVGQDASSAVGDVFGEIRSGPVLAVAVLLIVVFVAPLCEEIVYRGLLWGGVERLAGRWVAFGVSTLLFALAHFEFTRMPLLLVVAIPIAVARLYTGRLLASIVAHQINNLLPGVMLMLGLLGVVPMA